MAKKKAITKPTHDGDTDTYLQELKDRLDTELLEIRTPYRAKQDELRTQCAKQIRQIQGECDKEVEALEQEYLEDADSHRAQRGTKVGEGSPGYESWEKAHRRYLARQTLRRDVRARLESYLPI